MIAVPGSAPRHRTIGVKVGGVTVGGGAPSVVQSMTNTDTADAEATAKQVAALARAGSEIVRICLLYTSDAADEGQHKPEPLREVKMIARNKPARSNDHKERREI